MPGMEQPEKKSQAGGLTAVAVSVLVIAAVAAALILPGMGSPEGTSSPLSAPSPGASSPAALPGAPGGPTTGTPPGPDLAGTEEGVAVNRWNLRAQSPISAILGFFELKWDDKSGPDRTQACRDLESMVALMNDLPPAPAPLVAGAFGAWTTSLGDIVDFCQAPRTGISAAQWEQSLDTRVMISSGRFSAFVDEVSRYVDLSRPAPADAALSLD